MNRQPPQRPRREDNPSSVNDAQRRSRERLRLPFDERRTDAGEWVYNSRRGLAVTLIAYLLLGIVFVAGRISVGGTPHRSDIIVDLTTLEQLDEERERLERENARLQNDEREWQRVRNLSSNEALNENLKDDRGTQTSQLNNTANEVERSMQANREAYERGMAEVAALGERPESGNRADDVTSSKVAGRVTVSYSFTDPVRHHRHLDKPAYKCEGGGEVVVSVTVDRNGEVVAAAVVSGGDACMRETAVRSARLSRFNIDSSAPARQTGSITYIFIPQ